MNGKRMKITVAEPMKVTVTAEVNLDTARLLLSLAGFDITKKTDKEVAEMAVRSNHIYGVTTKSVKCDAVEEKKPAKPLSEIRGFDDVAIGLIPRDAGEGKYIDIHSLEGYDLSGIQAYRYSLTSMSMRPTAHVDVDMDVADHLYCVKRADLEEKLSPTDGTKPIVERLRARMLERDQDCSPQNNAVDKGYHLAVLHMCEEIDSLTGEIH